MCNEHETLRNVISNQFEFTLLIASEGECQLHSHSEYFKYSTIYVNAVKQISMSRHQNLYRTEVVSRYYSNIKLF